MTENTYYKPILVVGRKEIHGGMTGSISFPGNNQSNSISCTIKDIDLQNHRLLNEEVKFYLNYGSDDGIPIFRGYIKELTPGTNSVTIKAIDARTFINSQDSKMVELTDKNNYDGYTLGAFLYDFIETEIKPSASLMHISASKKIIGLSMLSDTYPPISLSGVRTPPTPAYQIVVNKLKEAVDDTKVEEPLDFFIDMIDDGDNSNITFVKNKSLTSAPQMTLSYGTGLQSYKYNRRAPVNYATSQGAKFQYGTAPLGIVGTQVAGKFKDRKEAQQQLIKEVLLQHQYVDQITVEATKGHYIGLGSIIAIDLDTEDTYSDIEVGHRNHRVTAKSIRFSDSAVNLSLSLNRVPYKLSNISAFVQLTE